MKTSILIVLITTILFLPAEIVIASKFYILEDFDNKTEQTILVPEKDAILFDYKQGRHAIIFERFNNKKGIDISIFIYQKSYNDLKIDQSSTFLSLKLGMQAFIDFDKDFVDDVRIKYLRQIKENATIEITSLNKSDINVIHTLLENSIEEVGIPNNSNNIIGISITFSIVILGLALFLVVARKKNKVV